MPLTSDPHDRCSNVDLFIIRFPMFDGGKMVNCSVSSEALQDLAAGDGKQGESIDLLFKFYRAEVEEIASAKYDKGRLVNGEIRVVNGDI
jgi:hypothetical protein